MFHFESLLTKNLDKMNIYIFYNKINFIQSNAGIATIQSKGIMHGDILHPCFEIDTSDKDN